MSLRDLMPKCESGDIVILDLRPPAKCKREEPTDPDKIAGPCVTRKLTPDERKKYGLDK